MVANSLRGAKLNDVFPGHLGRLMLSTVVLRLHLPELLEAPMDTPLDPELESQLRSALHEIRTGR